MLYYKSLTSRHHTLFYEFNKQARETEVVGKPLSNVWSQVIITLLLTWRNPLIGEIMHTVS